MPRGAAGGTGSLTVTGAGTDTHLPGGIGGQGHERPVAIQLHQRLGPVTRPGRGVFVRRNPARAGAWMDYVARARNGVANTDGGNIGAAVTSML